MGNKTRALTRAALLAGLSFVLLLLGAVLPSGRLALTACAGVLTALVLLQSGLAYAIGAFLCAGILGILLLPQKAPGILYLAFLGYYPIIKSLAERLRHRWLEWVLKLGIFNGAFFLLWMVAREFLAPGIVISLPLLLLGANVIFVVYDRGLSGLIHYYIVRISKQIS